MKKSKFGFILLIILFTSYIPKSSFLNNSNLSIKKIEIYNNSILDKEELKKNLNFLYQENLFFLKTEDIEKKLKEEPFIESFSIKKIYPSTLKLTIVEKKVIAIVHDKKKKLFISNKGNLIKYKDLIFETKIPIVFGGKNSFFKLYENLEIIQFPVENVKENLP